MKARRSDSVPSRHQALRAAGAEFTVREAKAGLSAILQQVAKGSEVTITSRGRPAARIVPMDQPGVPFAVDLEWLRTMRVRGSGRPAEQLVREDRDARG
jgi:prevent-host-death family protein